MAPHPFPHDRHAAPATTPLVPRSRGLRVSLHADGTGTLTPLPGARVRAADVRAELDHLAESGVHTLDDLADLAVDELTEITGQSDDEAKALIMKAREHWFAQEKGA